MDRHSQAVILEHCIGLFMRIKSLSMSGEIDRCCVSGVSKLYDLSEARGLQKEIDLIRKRRFVDE